ncbi:MAG: hypothetical protein PHU08_00030 [Dehalococcoidales bacterium]|nr:hypothetical protein [Dehalococcoidales bacterium]
MPANIKPVSEHLVEEEAEQLLDEFTDTFDWRFLDVDKRALRELIGYAHERGYQAGYGARREGK